MLYAFIVHFLLCINLLIDQNECFMYECITWILAFAEQSEAKMCKHLKCELCDYRYVDSYAQNAIFCVHV